MLCVGRTLTLYVSSRAILRRSGLDDDARARMACRRNIIPM